MLTHLKRGSYNSKNLQYFPAHPSLEELKTDFLKPRNYFWFGFEKQSSYESDLNNKIPIKSTSKKTNLPKKYPGEIKEFVSSVKSELLGSEYRKVHPNLTLEERDALAELIAHQKSGSIVIQPADKGSGSCILDRVDYENEAKGQLTDT